MVVLLAACLLVAALGRWLGQQPALPVTLGLASDGRVVVRSAEDPSALLAVGHTVLSLRPIHDDTRALPLNRLALNPSTRWLMSATARAESQAQWHALLQLQRDSAARGWTMALQLDGAPDVAIEVRPLGWRGLGILFWLLSGLAVVMLGVSAAVWLNAPANRGAVYALLALSQAAQLLWLAVGSTLDVFRPDGWLWLDQRWPALFDLVSAGAVLHIATLHPHGVRHARPWALLGWLVALAVWLWQGREPSSAGWWWLQLTWMALLSAAAGVMTGSLQRQPHPLTLVLRRLVLVSLLSWGLLSVAVWLGRPRPDMQWSLMAYGVITLHVFMASQVLLAPYLSRSRQVLQEFSMVAASSTVAGSLDLLFVGAFSMSALTSMTLSLCLAMGLYWLARRWVMAQLTGQDAISMERMFQRMYRIAREVARQPETLHASLTALLRELFDPLEVRVVHGAVRQPSLRSEGAVLLVPLPHEGPSATAPLLLLKHSHKGRRLFTTEDARLAQRVLEQLHRAVSFDKAVEQGRSEERLRIAQDLHDDIGARLLTLMYQAPNAEIEEYIRHTIQDLKTLTRGLAAQSHSLCEAASEWKRDIQQRLTVARCELQWDLDADCDVKLSMVQWSALTRILRELVSNAISHAKAKQVHIALSLQQDRLTLSVSDNGIGQDPSAWAHGLGLGGVRKRVKQLGGSVRWLALAPQGIRCEVVVAAFSGSQTTHQTSGSTSGPDSQLSH